MISRTLHRSIRIYTKGRLAGPLLVWALGVWSLSVGPLRVWHLWIWHLWVRARTNPWCRRLSVGGLAIIGWTVGPWCRIRRGSWTLAVVWWRHSEGISFGGPVDIVVQGVIFPHHRVGLLVLRHVSFPHCSPLSLSDAQ